MLVRLPSLLRGWLNEGRYSEEWCTAAGVEREREREWFSNVCEREDGGKEGREMVYIYLF